MASSTTRKLRCAIYTRKSTEEGLDQAFNSLDAQREACAAYVLSQQHEGWTLVPDYYDDGGYSGGNIDRPGLQQLLADVKSGRIDVIVVYKIDRLTRSLTDFAKIVEVFDAAGASFVSVTQAFNTTTSMGRLTLNVLLSFAQFEREVIAERIRDKVAASKAKGIWMGGRLALGYDVKDRQLVIVPEEARAVRQIMERYLAADSVQALVTELRRNGIVNKRRKMRDGSFSGGTPFARGGICWLLSNRIYVGEIRHKDKAYPGQHEAIVSRELFDAVQAKLAERTNPCSEKPSRKVVSLLAGMIRDHRGRPMSPAHTRKQGRRYRYYVANRNDDATPPLLRLPAGELDAAVRKALASFLADTDQARELAKDCGTERLAGFVNYCSRTSRDVTSASTPELHAILRSLDFRMIVQPDHIRAHISGSALLNSNGISDADAPAIELSIPVHQTSFGHEQRLRLDPQSAVPTLTDQKLIDFVARSFAARDQLLAMGQEEVDAMPLNELRHLQRIARLAYLDPTIVRAILDGSQPKHLTARGLRNLGSLPLAFAEQRKELCISAH